MAILTRGLAVAFVAAAIAACYSPAVRDCTVTCASATDCAGGQVCGTDKMCASPDIAGHCDTLGARDAGAGDTALPDDASRADARAPDGGAMIVQLHVHVDNNGSVSVDGIGLCDSNAPGHGDCTYQILTGIAITMHAFPHLGSQFDKWTGACNGANTTCTVTASGALDVHAKFKGQGD